MLTDSQYSTCLLNKCPPPKHLSLSGIYGLVKHLTSSFGQSIATLRLPHASSMTLVLVKSASFRSSRLDVFCRKDVLRNFETATLSKRRLWHRCRYFPVNFAKFLRTPFFTEHLRWLLLKFPTSSVSNTSINFL